MHNMHLYIDGLRIPIRNFYYHFTQYTDQRNKPVSRVLGGEFGFSYEPTNENLSLTEWMVDPFETKKGYIEIMSFQEQKIAGKLEFELAYAVDLTYHFNARRHDFPFEAHLVVRAGALRLNREVVYLQNWLRKDPFEVEEETVIAGEDDVAEEPRLYNYRFEDENGCNVKQNSIKVGDQVTLVVKTEGCIGKTLYLNLNDTRLDYEHKGRILENDILRVDVTEDQQYIPLTAIAPE